MEKSQSIKAKEGNFTITSEAPALMFKATGNQGEKDNIGCLNAYQSKQAQVFQEHQQMMSYAEIIMFLLIHFRGGEDMSIT